ncbi:MAG: hypothetical protein SNH63_05630 [Rikenellaceae bacterium]
MMKIYIDDTLVSDNNDTKVLLSFDAEALSAIETEREAYDVSVTVVRTAANAAIFGGEGFLHARARFNAEEHTASITYNDELIVEGRVIIKEIVREGQVTKYVLRVRRSGADWAHNTATATLSSSNIDYEIYLTTTDIQAAWSENLSVQFVPVYRDCYVATSQSTTTDAVRVMHSVDDYYPFLNIRDIVESIFASSDFAVESQFMDSQFFDTLYMSGCYSSQDNEQAREAMNFYVKRLDDSSASATSYGRVYLSSQSALNSVGNMVDIESLTSSEECFTRNNCFSQDDYGVQSFTPTTQVSVGFEFHLNYECDYLIASREKLQTFDTIYLYDGNMITIEVLNKNEDLRGGQIASNFNYSPIVFEASSSDSFRVVACIGSSTTPTVIGEWMGRMGSVTTLVTSSTIGELSLQILSGGEYVDSSLDWALYYGAVAERGTVEIDLTVRTTPKSLSPDSVMEFKGMFAQGAEAGAAFKLLAGTSIKPVFATHPGAATIVQWEDISKHSYTQAELLAALQHMFNLRFYTDYLAQKIYIDPSEMLYDQSDTWDWGDRVLAEQGYSFEDRAMEVHHTRVWGYQSGDGLINRVSTDYMVPGTTLPTAPESSPEQSVDGASSPQFGAWSIPMESSAVLQSVDTQLNPIFSPSLNDLDGLLIVGDRDDEDLVDSYDFAPRIVRWLGMVESDGEQIPHMAFHSSSDTQATLCFEDRDGARGLNQYYGDEVLRDCEVQYVTLYLRLTPHDVVMLLSPSEGAPTLFSTFRLLIDGEWAVCRLMNIYSYELGTQSAKCRFLVLE